MRIEIDKAAHTITLQGEWWYRGTHQVMAHDGGSQITYAVYNVAPGVTRWLAALMQRELDARMKTDLQHLLEGIRQRLGVPL